MRRPSLASLLVAPQGQLAPQHAPGQVVSTPHAVPDNIRFGSSPPGFGQSSRYTGGAVVPQAGSGQFTAPPDFVAPTYATPQLNPVPTAATVASLILHGGLFRPPVPRATNPTTPQVVPMGVSGDTRTTGTAPSSLGGGGGFKVQTPFTLAPSAPRVSGIGYTPVQNAVSNSLGSPSPYRPLNVSAANLAARGRAGVYIS